jgi:hypothetical protein
MLKKSFYSLLRDIAQRITQCRARAVIISIWVVSITVALPFAVYRKLFEIQVRSLLWISFFSIILKFMFLQTIFLLQ